MRFLCLPVFSLLLCSSSPFSLSTPMMEVENFTIFIKNSIRFPTFNYTKYDNYYFKYDDDGDDDDDTNN